MKKLFAVFIMVFVSLFLFAEQKTEKYHTGDCMRHGVSCNVHINNYDTRGKHYSKFPSRVYAVIPWQDGYILKVSFSEQDNFLPAVELFVKPGTQIELIDCFFAEVVSVAPNEIEIHYVESEEDL